MDRFVHLWVYLSATPLFGLTATLVTYVLAHAVYVRVAQAPWANPVLWTVLALVALLALTGTPYPTYFAGAQFIHFLLGPEIRGFALGTASHGIGAARALQVHPDAGAYAGLALGLQVVLSTLLLPLLGRLVF